MTPTERKFKSRKASIMGIIVNLDVMMAKRKISLTELANQVDLTQANLSILKNNKAKAIRFSTLESICEVLHCQTFWNMWKIQKKRKTIKS
jgi:putative transcriptional regulator